LRGLCFHETPISTGGESLAWKYPFAKMESSILEIVNKFVGVIPSHFGRDLSQLPACGHRKLSQERIVCESPT
jgi:hypothetical protein